MAAARDPVLVVLGEAAGHLCDREEIRIRAKAGDAGDLCLAALPARNDGDSFGAPSDENHGLAEPVQVGLPLPEERGQLLGELVTRLPFGREPVNRHGAKGLVVHRRETDYAAAGDHR